jgi:peptide chain release factor 1
VADFLERIAEASARSRELETQLSDPEIGKEPGAIEKLGKRLGALRPLLEVGERYRTAVSELEDSKAMLEDDDAEMQELARAEIERLEEEIPALETELRVLLTPKDPNDEKDAIFEIRAGTGGDEAALFAADLFRMYTRYAESLGWRIDTLSSSETDGGGFKEIIASISGTDVFSRFKYEKGVHRVQRVPATESQGRIHTSTVTVAVMPEAEDVDVDIKNEDLRIDVMRAGGPGGQSVNTTDSAVRITHLPSGLVVQCQDEKSQHKNKAKAMTVLRTRLFDLEQEKAAAERASERRSQVGTGERSEKIRTYNFPQSRVTDHRAGVTLHKLDQVMAGEMDELLDAVHAAIVAAKEGEPQGAERGRAVVTGRDPVQRIDAVVTVEPEATCHCLR